MKRGSDTTGFRDSWFAIVNPAAGEGLGGKEWPRIEMLLRKAGVRYETAFTQHKYHAVELTVRAVNSGIRHIMVVGGTTTLHEVVNGLFIQKAVSAEEIILGIIPLITPYGEDGIQGIPTHYPEAVQAVASGYFSFYTVASVMYHNSSYGQERYALSCVEGGLEAALLKKISQQREEGYHSPLHRWLGAANTVLKYRFPSVKIWVDGKLAVDSRIAGLHIRIQGREPHTTAASVNLSVTYRLRRLLPILHARRLCRGLTCGAPSQTFTGTDIRIESWPPLAISADGEMLGYSPAQLRVEEKYVRMAVPEKHDGTHPEAPPFPSSVSIPPHKHKPIRINCLRKG